MVKKVWAGIVLGGLLVPALVAAAEIRVGEQPSLPSNERVSDDFYIAGGNVSSSGPITGDLVAAGGNLLINSAVTQDVIAGGGSISILGTVGDDVRVGGGNITINARVGGDVVVGGGQTQIAGTGVGGDIVWGGGALRIEAPVNGDLKLGGGEVYINAPVRGNVDFHGEKLTLGSAAVIQGNLSYKSPNEATLEEGAVVRGETAYEKQEMRGDAAKAGLAFFTIAVFVKFVMLLVSALLIGLLLHRFSHTAVTHVAAQPLTELGRGFITFVVLPFASAILLMTVVGVPLGILGLIAYVAMLIFGCLVAPIILGSFVHKWALKPAGYEVTWVTILIGVVLYTILGWIPVLGWVVKFGLLLLALGAMTNIKLNALKEWR